MNTFTGRTIVVTGAARGIGAALATRLRARGATVFAIDRQAVAEGPSLAVDLSDPGAVAAAAGQLPARIDGLACVAGVPGTLDPGTVLAVNFVGTRDLAQLCLPRMSAGAACVFVSSVTAHRCTWPSQALEALARADAVSAPGFLEGLDGTAAYELSKRVLNHWILTRLPQFSESGLRANIVSPGPVQTAILADFETSIGKDRLDAAAAIAGRHAQPEEIAAAIAFLLGPDAGWINGVELKVDGGYHALRAAREFAAAGAA